MKIRIRTLYGCSSCDDVHDDESWVREGWQPEVTKI